LLEYFFAENPFPTHADKVFLARKSAMTYRQIHVWVRVIIGTLDPDVDDLKKFQNKRNKMKKEGRVLRKKAVAEGAILPLDSLYQRMERFIVLEKRKALALPPSPLHIPTKQGDKMVSVVSPCIFILFT
jgi:hypothetical protein